MRKNKSLEKSASSLLPAIPNINDEIFERAGITKDDRAKLLNSIFKKTIERLEAKHVKVFNHNGKIIRSSPLVDHATQGKAVDQAMQLVGLSKDAQPKVIVKANVTLPEWACPKPSPVDITPKPTPTNDVETNRDRVKGSSE